MPLAICHFEQPFFLTISSVPTCPSLCQISLLVIQSLQQTPSIFLGTFISRWPWIFQLPKLHIHTLNEKCINFQNMARMKLQSFTNIWSLGMKESKYILPFKALLLLLAACRQKEVCEAFNVIQKCLPFSMLMFTSASVQLAPVTYSNWLHATSKFLPKFFIISLEQNCTEYLHFATNVPKYNTST